ncbi:MAG: GldG family protein [Deltaproteobacteria bacterium]|nr:GldG family protein [Deltaproteobacteria bacterium]
MAPTVAQAPACTGLAPGTVRLLLSLKQPLTVEAYVTRGTRKLDAFVQELERVLTEFERAGNGKLSIRIIDVRTDQQLQAAKDAGIKEQTFEQSPGKHMGLAFRYGAQKDTYPALSPDQLEGLEFGVAKVIRDLRDQTDGIRRRIGVLSGKDELDIRTPELIAANPKAPSMQGIVTQTFPFVQFETVDLRGGAAEIDRGLQALIITQPGSDFTEPELTRIDEFVLRGKSLAVFASAVNLRAADASMKASLSTHGLDQLLRGYGIEMIREAVLDWNNQRIPIVNEKGATLWIRAPGLAVPKHTQGLRPSEQTLNTDFPGFIHLDELAVPFPSGLIIHPQRQPRARFTTIARTTPGATAVSGDIVDFRPSRDAKPIPPFETRDIAVAVEGTLTRSIAAGKPDAAGVTGASSRVIVVSSSCFLANPYARAGKAAGTAAADEMLEEISEPYAMHYLTNTILSFKNILDWLTEDRDMADPISRLPATCTR